MNALPPLLSQLAGRLVVSCQAYPGEPMRSTTVIAAIAETVVAAGAEGVRLQGLDDIATVSARLDVPIIGLVKVGREGVFITPTVRHVKEVCEAGADIVAMDGTSRPRPDGAPLAESVQLAHDLGKLVMADCSSVQDAWSCAEIGVDVIGTTLAGYAGPRERTAGPDLGLIKELVRVIDIPVFAEGRIRTPEDANACLDAGAFAVVVGSAITHPGRITEWFVQSLETRQR